MGEQRPRSTEDALRATCTCKPPDGVTRNHANGCALFDVDAAFRQGYAAAPSPGPDLREARVALWTAIRQFEAIENGLENGGDLYTEVAIGINGAKKGLAALDTPVTTRTEASDLGSERGRLLAERDRLIALGVDPDDLERLVTPRTEASDTTPSDKE